MKHVLHTLVRAALLFALVALFVWPSFAQDSATAEPTVEAPADETTDASGGSVILNVWQIIGGVIAAVSAGGLLGFAGAGTLAKRLQNNAATMAAIEALAKSAPPEIIKILAEIGSSGKAIGELLTEATDDVPASSKSVTISAQTSAEPLA